MNPEADERGKLRQSMLLYIDGVLPEERVLELSEQLKGDAAARAEFGEILIQCVQLDKIGRQNRVQAILPHAAPLGKPVGLLWKGGAIAAGALIVIGLLAILTAPPRQAPTRDTALRPGTPVLPADETVTPAGRPETPAVPEERTALQEPPVNAARVEEVRGEAFALTPAGRLPVAAGTMLRSGQGLETAGAGSLALLRYEDATRLRVLGDSRILDLREAGTRGILERGGFEAETARKPIVYSTPHGDVLVRPAGVFRVRVEAGSTRLEVAQGEGELKRKADGKTARVPAGCFAEASADAAPVATWKGPGGRAAQQLALQGTVTINFGPEGTPLPEGVLNDSGEEFETARGYGWKGPKEGKELPGVILSRPDGKRLPLKAGRGPWLSERLVGSLGPLRASYVVAGGRDHTETWILPVPNGRYRVTICCGDPDQPQGPHHVSVEGVQVIEAVITKAGEFVGIKDLPVDVKDGELTLISGGGRGGPPDGDSSTALNYLVITRTSE